MTVSKYKMMAESDQYKTPAYIDYNDIERKYWKNIIYNPPLYGADIPGSVTDKDVEVSIFSIQFLNFHLFFLSSFFIYIV